MRTPQQWLTWWQAQDVMDEDAALKMIARIQRDAMKVRHDRLLDWCAAWLIRARQALTREGWEEGMTFNEASAALRDVLHNLGCDEGTGSRRHIAEHKRLLALPLRYSPPRPRR